MPRGMRPNQEHRTGVAYPVDLSVVIPAWNEAESLEETVDSISGALRANEAHGLAWEIIVCDNASTDDTPEIARRAGARVVYEPERGIAAARNAGARVARGEWLLFIDADTHPPPELLSDVRALVGEGGIVGCGSLMRPIGGSGHDCLPYEETADPGCTGVGRGDSNRAIWLREDLPTAFYNTTSETSISPRRKAARKALTTVGSKCVPASFSMMLTTSCGDMAFL